MRPTAASICPKPNSTPTQIRTERQSHPPRGLRSFLPRLFCVFVLSCSVLNLIIFSLPEDSASEGTALRAQTVAAEDISISAANIVDGSSHLSELAVEDPGAVAKALSDLDLAYEGGSANAFHLRGINDKEVEVEITRTMGMQLAGTYGELLPPTVVKMLQNVTARVGQRYYDLGSGTGKTAALAWLLGLDATGVELSTARWRVGCDTLERLRRASSFQPGDPSNKRKPVLRHIRASFLDIDFSDADILFVNSLMFSADIIRQIARTARQMRPGAYVVAPLSHPLPGPGFRMASYFFGSASWSKQGKEALWGVQEVVGHTDGVAVAKDTNLGKRVSNALEYATLEHCELLV